MSDFDPRAGANGSVACAHADRCSGCPLIGLPYDAQLARKRERVASALRAYPPLQDVGVAPTASAEPVVEYRVRAKLIVAPGARVGLYAAGTDHEVVDLPECRVLAPELRRTAEAIRGLLAAPPPAAGAALVPFGGERAGALTAVDLRLTMDETGTERVLLTLVLDRERAPARPELLAAADAVRGAAPAVAGVAVNLHAPGSPQVLGPSTQVVAGAATARDYTGQSFHLATYGAFVQAHRGQARAVHQQIEQGLGRTAPLAGQRVLDVYGGSGAIALCLARAGAQVTLVESFGPAVDNACEAAKQQGLTPSAPPGQGTGTLAARVGDAATELDRLARAGEAFDAVVVNPPRRGVDPLARRAIARLTPRTVAYVSCNPNSLARDLDHFARLGYRCATVQPFDMIPLTDQVETLTILDRGRPTPAEILYEDPDWVAAVKAPHEPLTRQPDHPIDFLARVALAVPGTRLTPATSLEAPASGVVLLSRGVGRQPDERRSALGGVEITYWALVRGVAPPRGRLTLERPAGHRRNGRGPVPGRQPPNAASVQYETVEILGRHSVVRLTSPLVPGDVVRRALARSGHPVLGDETWGHEPTNRHFEEKYGLDRLFWHCESLRVPELGAAGLCVFRSPPSPDLGSVLSGLRADCATRSC